MSSTVEQARVAIKLDGRDAESVLDDLTTKVNKYTKALEKAYGAGDKDAMKAANKSLKAAERELSNFKKQAFEVQKVLNDLNGSSFNDLVKAERKLRAEMKGLRRDSKEYAKTRADWNQVKGAIKSTTQTTTGMSKAMSMLKMALPVLSIGTLISGLKTYIATAGETRKLTSQVAKQFDLTRDTARDVTGRIRGLAKAYDSEFNDVMRSAKILTEEFKISQTSALDLIEQGFEKGANVNGEFLEQLKEYPAQLKSVGFSAEQTIAIITQSENSGVFSDKGIDAIKEAGLRLREMPNATTTALKGIGLSGKTIQEQLKNGETTLWEVMQRVSEKLNELPEDSAEVGAAIADIFGGPGEDAGLRYLQTLKDVDIELGNIETSLDETEIAQNKLTKAWENFKTSTTKGDGAVARFFASTKTKLADILNGMSVMGSAFKSSANATERDASRMLDALLETSIGIGERVQSVYDQAMNMADATAEEQAAAFKASLLNLGIAEERATLFAEEFSRRRIAQIEEEKKAKETLATTTPTGLSEADKAKLLEDAKEFAKQYKDAFKHSDTYDDGDFWQVFETETYIEQLEAQLDAEAATVDRSIQLEADKYEKMGAMRQKDFDDQVEYLTNLKAKAQDYTSYATDLLMQALEDGKVTSEEMMSIMVLTLLRGVKNTLTAAITQATITSLAQPDSIATFGASGAVRAGIMVGLLEAAYKGIESSLKSTMGFYTGGYTGDGSPTEVAGVTHKREYVIPEYEMRNPAIQDYVWNVIEPQRVRRLNLPAVRTAITSNRGFYNGGPTSSNTPGESTGNNQNTEVLLQLISVINTLSQQLSNGIESNVSLTKIDNARAELDAIKSFAKGK